VILDSGFCILKGIIELKNVGVYAGALIKKRRYWPKHVPGDATDRYFQDKEVRSFDALCGYMNCMPYQIFCMKEPECAMKIMATYSELTVPQSQKTFFQKLVGPSGTHREVSFKYTEPFANHFSNIVMRSTIIISFVIRFLQ